MGVILGGLRRIIWVLVIGLPTALLWCVFGLITCLTIIGAPYGVQCFGIALYSLWPFGKNSAGSFFGCFLPNFLWLIVFGLALSVFYLAAAVACVATIICIPLALECLKMVKVALSPFGTQIG